MFLLPCYNFLTAYIQLFSTTPGLRDLLNDNEVKRNQITVLEDKDDPPRGDGSYDPKKRDPQWANAHRSCLWELVGAIRSAKLRYINLTLRISFPFCIITIRLSRFTLVSF